MRSRKITVLEINFHVASTWQSDIFVYKKHICHFHHGWSLKVTFVPRSCTKQCNLQPLIFLDCSNKNKHGYLKGLYFENPARKNNLLQIRDFDPKSHFPPIDNCLYCAIFCVTSSLWNTNCRILAERAASKTMMGYR